MKKLFKNISVYISIFVFVFLFSAHTHFASSNIPFHYNVIPVEANNSIIDTKKQKHIEFKLYEKMDSIYYNNQLIKLENNTFSIDVSKLTGEQTLTFMNADNQSISFSYYFSDKKGKVDGYELVEGKKLTTYVTTFKNVKIIYSNKEISASKRLVSFLKKLPDTLLENLDTITLIPYETTSNVAGVTKDNTITLYKFSKYSTSTQKNIIYHEIAHTWANKLIQLKVIDYSYTEYSQFIENDNNFVSKYSKSYIEEKGKYNEDFADSVALYIMNQRSFKKKYPCRFEYVNRLIKLKNEEKEDDKID